MNELEKHYTDAIIETLKAILSSDKGLIDKGQEQLNVLESRSEFSYLLIKILLDQSINFGIRQLAGVLFKQYVEIHWSTNSEKFKEPEIQSAYKMKIKQILPIGLADQLSKIRITVAYAIATIAHWDWPELWPELFPTLIQGLSGSDLNAIHGSIKTLSEFIDEVTDIQMPHVAPALMPQIYNIFINPQHYQIRLRARSIEIFNSLVNVVAEMSEYDTGAIKKYLNPYLSNFLNAMIKSLSLPDDNQTMDYGLKKDIIKALTTLVKSFPKKLSNYMNDILAQVWNCIVQSSNFYVTTVVNCSKENRDDPVDAEGEDLSFENLVYQLFDFILCLKEKNRYKLIIKKAIEELCYYGILYMQITEDQMELWMNNPDQFVEEEDEETFSYSVRICSQELLESITNDFKKESAIAICKAIGRHIEYAHTLKQSNNPNWWKVHEACLLAIGIIKQVIQDLSSANMLDFDLNAFINQVVIASLCESNYPFLVGRALYTASKFSKLMHLETLQKLVEATAAALQINQNPIIRLSAMRAIYCFCEEMTDETKQPILIAYLQQIGEGLIQMTTENLNNPIGALALETLCIVLSIDEKFVAAIENKISPLSIAIFLKHANDPLINSIVIDIFKVLISNSYTNQKIEQRLIPTLNSILNTSSNNQKDLSGLLTSSLDLLTTFVRSSTIVPLSDYLINMFVVVVNLCLKNDDTGILQSGGECLRAFISKSSEQIINWKNENGISALNYIVMVINHILDPKTSENSCSFIGKFINTVIRHTGHALGDNLDLILKAVLSKMQSSQVLLVQQSLIIVFAHLIHAQMDNVLVFLSNLPGPTGKPVLEFLISEWVGKQNSFVGPYECKISILALAKVLEHAISKDDKRFQNIFVKGDRIINPIEGIKTRSKSKSDKELYTQVPLLVKIYKLLINELNNQIEDRKDENGEDYEEYDDYDDDEEGEDDSINGINSDECAVDDQNNIEIDQDNENLNKYLNRYDLYDEIFEKDEIFEEDDPEALTDPLMKIDLLEYLTQYLQTLSQQPCYNLFKQHHNDIEKDVLKQIGINV